MASKLEAVTDVLIIFTASPGTPDLNVYPDRVCRVCFTFIYESAVSYEQ